LVLWFDSAEQFSLPNTQLPRSYGPIRHPKRPGLSLAGFRLAGHAPAASGASRVATISLRSHAAANTPVESSGARLALFPADSSLPCLEGRLASTSAFSGPAQRSLHVAACGLAGSPTRPFPSKASAVSSPPRLLRLLPAGAKVAGWVCLPLGDRAFPRRTSRLA
jgi:hypothetical protein